MVGPSLAWLQKIVKIVGNISPGVEDFLAGCWYHGSDLGVKSLSSPLSVFSHLASSMPWIIVHKKAVKRVLAVCQ